MSTTSQTLDRQRPASRSEILAEQVLRQLIEQAGAWCIRRRSIAVTAWRLSCKWLRHAQAAASYVCMVCRGLCVLVM